jgi:hypothetical protein
MDLQGGLSEAAANKSNARRIYVHAQYVIERGGIKHPVSRLYKRRRAARESAYAQ